MRVNAESLEMSNIHWLVFICHNVTVLCSCVSFSGSDCRVDARTVHWLWCNSCHGDDFTENVSVSYSMKRVGGICRSGCQENHKSAVVQQLKVNDVTAKQLVGLQCYQVGTYYLMPFEL